MDGAPARRLPDTLPQPQRLPPRQTNRRPTVLKKVKKKLKWFSVRRGIDLTFLFLVLTLLIIGMIMMFSASYPSSYEETGSSLVYLQRQLIFAGLGLGAMVFLSYLDYHHLHKFAIPMLILALGGLVYVLVMPSNGVRRWIDFKLFTVQASEIAKLAVILFLAHWGSVYFKKMDTFRYGVLPPILLMGGIGFLLLEEPHYSGIAIIGSLIVLMMFISGVKLRYFVILFALIAVLVIGLAITGNLGYAMTRLHGWGQALTYVDEQLWQETYQTRNSLYAIGSGGFWGLGLGQSRQKYLYIPEVQNDFVFAVVCEELGFIGAAIILCLFALLVWRGITISMRAQDKFGSLLGIGLSAQIGLQVILNIMVITDWLPNTGISLPFFSFGGSSLVMLLAQMGIILSISRTANLDKA